MDEQAELEALEELVDRIDLAGVLAHLSTIAFGKAEHIRSNWQDDASARYFDRAGRYLDTAATREAIVDTSTIRGSEYRKEAMARLRESVPEGVEVFTVDEFIDAVGGPEGHADTQD